MGASGAGMTAVSEIARAAGFEVSGCDLKTGGHDVAHLQNIDILAVTPAVFYQSAKHPELIEAQKKGIAMTWQEFMGKYLHRGKKVICIAGTHGKSTTTTMVGLVFELAGFDPTVEVGASVPVWHGHCRVGQGQYFVSEADEFYSNFLHYHPDIVILNNIELDHPEYFHTFDNLLLTYQKFLNNIKPGGVLIYHESVEKFLIFNFKFSVNFQKIKFSNNDFPKDLTLKIPGDHNKTNAAGVITLAKLLKIPESVYKKSLSEFGGIDRRLQELGTVNGITVVDDYANHPTAFAANIKALREKYSEKPIWAIIEPHTFSRLRAVLPELAPALKEADRVIVSKIFASRETDPGDFTGADIAAAVPGALYISEFPDIVQYLRSKIHDQVIVLVMGSGNSDKLARDIFNNLQTK
jgi:UDP-N-acetylmuramate--alanine ligase